jgi:hypothetical protein
MNAHLIERQFAKIGARALVRTDARRKVETGVRIDVGHDVEGEFFDIAVIRGVASDLTVIDTQPRLRHLLLMSRDEDGKHKFLCGHDERTWFVAAVPERLPVSTVRTAFEALKPETVRHMQDHVVRVKPRKRNRRRNKAFIRQGEWFFVPAPAWFRANPKLLLRKEPLRRGAGQAHVCDELIRDGGELVYVSAKYPQGLTAAEHRRLISRQPKLRNLHWAVQRRNPRVFVRGKVRHADHKTIVLPDWHQVLMNTETESVAMRHVAFID